MAEESKEEECRHHNQRERREALVLMGGALRGAGDGRTRPCTANLNPNGLLLFSPEFIHRDYTAMFSLSVPRTYKITTTTLGATEMDWTAPRTDRRSGS